jgi:hypothetical protein
MIHFLPAPIQYVFCFATYQTNPGLQLIILSNRRLFKRNRRIQKDETASFGNQQEGDSEGQLL